MNALASRTYAAWLGFGRFLGSCVSSIIFAVIFIVVLGPVGLVMRLRGSVGGVLSTTGGWHRREERGAVLEKLKRPF